MFVAHRLMVLFVVSLSALLGACEGSTDRRLFESCESTPECAVGLDCVVLRAQPSGTTAGAGFCTFRCDPRFPCSPSLNCTAVDSEGVVVAPEDPAARNAFCLRGCAEDRDCAASLSCEVSASGALCL